MKVVLLAAAIFIGLAGCSHAGPAQPSATVQRVELALEASPQGTVVFVPFVTGPNGSIAVQATFEVVRPRDVFVLGPDNLSVTRLALWPGQSSATDVRVSGFAPAASDEVRDETYGALLPDAGQHVLVLAYESRMPVSAAVVLGNASAVGKVTARGGYQFWDARRLAEAPGEFASGGRGPAEFRHQAVLHVEHGGILFVGMAVDQGTATFSLLQDERGQQEQLADGESILESVGVGAGDWDVSIEGSWAVGTLVWSFVPVPTPLTGLSDLGDGQPCPLTC